MIQCERCKKDVKSFSMSWFNTEMICEECKTKETKHPKYYEARIREKDECDKHNYNFEGIGLPSNYEI